MKSLSGPCSHSIYSFNSFADFRGEKKAQIVLSDSSRRISPSWTDLKNPHGHLLKPPERSIFQMENRNELIRQKKKNFCLIISSQAVIRARAPTWSLTDVLISPLMLIHQCTLILARPGFYAACFSNAFIPGSCRGGSRCHAAKPPEWKCQWMNS